MGERRDAREDHARARESLAAYVAGDLGPEEERSVERHLEACAACREEEAGLRETDERIAEASAAAASPPPDLKGRILAALPTPRATIPPRRLLRGAAAAALLLFALLASLAAYSAEVFDRPAATATLSPTELAPGASGELEIRDAGVNAEVSLEVRGLPRTGPYEYYELWFGREGGRVSAGTFTVGDDGRGTLSASAPPLSWGYQRAGITLERFPEEPRLDAATPVLRGDLEES